MIVIYKYPVDPEFQLSLPINAQILTVQMQGDTPHMWVKLHRDEPKRIRKFITFGTGHKIPDNLDLLYIGTFQPEGLVFHLFEILP